MGIKDWFKKKSKGENKKDPRDIEGVETFEEWQQRTGAKAAYASKMMEHLDN